VGSGPIDTGFDPKRALGIQNAGGLLVPSWPLPCSLPPLSGTSCDACLLDDLDYELAILCTDDYLISGLERASSSHSAIKA
jgi:hypothetical protein